MEVGHRGDAAMVFSFFMRVVVRAVFVRAAFGDGFGAFHH